MMDWLPMPSDFRGDLRRAREASAAERLELLAALSRLLQDGEVRESLIEAADAAHVVGVFKTGVR